MFLLVQKKFIISSFFPVNEELQSGVDDMSGCPLLSGILRQTMVVNLAK